jgi:hypothetical protein
MPPLPSSRLAEEGVPAPFSADGMGFAEATLIREEMGKGIQYGCRKKRLILETQTDDT